MGREVCDLMAGSREGAEDSCFRHPSDEVKKKIKTPRKATTQGGSYSNKASLEQGNARAFQGCASLACVE